MHTLVDLVDTAAQRGLQRLQALPDRGVQHAGQRVGLAVLLVQVAVDVVEALVDVGQLVLEAVHPAGDALEAPTDAVEAAVQLRERLGQLVDNALESAAELGDGAVLRLQLGQRLVEALGQHADLGAVGQLRQPLANGTQRFERGHPRMDLVEGVEDLLLFALTDLRGAREHVAHPIEGHRGVVVLVHGWGLRPWGWGDSATLASYSRRHEPAPRILTKTCPYLRRSEHAASLVGPSRSSFGC